MPGNNISRAALGRLPLYLNYLKDLPLAQRNISATQIADALALGNVQVRKDLAMVSSEGKPKVGYERLELVRALEQYLGQNRLCQAAVVGAGKLGRALLDYEGFSDYGIEIAAAFDILPEVKRSSSLRKPIYPMEEFESFCYRSDIHIGIITVPKASAQEVCDLMVRCNFMAIWNFSPYTLKVPPNVRVKQEELALSLAHLAKLT